MSHRNGVLDIARGLAIILVVIGHSGTYKYIRDSIYLFHMPLFFFISGILLKYDATSVKKCFGGGKIAIFKALYSICPEYKHTINSKPFYV